MVSKNLQKCIRVLSEALKADVSHENIEIISSSLEVVGKILESSYVRQDALRRNEISCILTLATKYSLIEGYSHFVKHLSPSLEQRAVYSSICGFASIFDAILQEAPIGQATTNFTRLLIKTSYSEITTHALLHFTGRNILQMCLSGKSVMNKLVKICYMMFLHKLEQSHTHYTGPFHESYNNLPICVFVYMKRLLCSHVSRFASSTLYIEGDPSSSPSLHKCEQRSTSAYTSTEELGNREMFIQQHLLLLHGHLLEAVKLLAPTFEVLTPWEDARGFLLEEDLLSIKLPADTTSHETLADMWEHVFDVIQLLFAMLRLEPTPHPLEEAVMGMALEVLMTLGASGFIECMSFATSLGQQLWKRLEEDLYSEKNARLAVRLCFAMQLNVESLGVLCPSDDSMVDELARCLNAQHSGTASAMRNAQKERGELLENSVKTKARFFEFTQPLFLVWIPCLRDLCKSGPVAASRATRHELLRVMHEEAFEALLERQIRWLCGPNAQTILTSYRAFLLEEAVNMVGTLIMCSPRICVNCELSLCATISKATPALIEELHSPEVCKQYEDMRMQAERFNVVGAISCTLAAYVAIGSGGRGLATLIGNAWEPGTVSKLEPRPLGVRYVHHAEMTTAESATFVQYSLPAFIRTMESCLDARFGQGPDIVLRMPRLLQSLVRDKDDSSVVTWMVCSILDLSLIPLMKRLYTSAFVNTSHSRSGSQRRVQCIVDSLNVLTTFVSLTSKPAITLLARESVHSGLLELLLDMLQSIPLDIKTCTDEAVEGQNARLEILTSTGAPFWAICWVVFFKLLLELERQLLNRPHAVPGDLLYDVSEATWEQLPSLDVIRSQGTGPWAVLATVGAPKSGRQCVIKSSRYWLGKVSGPCASKDISGFFCFLPSVELAIGLVDSIKEVVAAECGEDSRLSDESPVIFPKGMISLIHIGCWSRNCRNMSGRSEASLPTSFCERCRTARYCCRDCQKADWLRHRGECKLWEKAVGGSRLP